jgi:hypothetical protein
MNRVSIGSTNSRSPISSGRCPYQKVGTFAGRRLESQARLFLGRDRNRSVGPAELPRDFVQRQERRPDLVDRREDESFLYQHVFVVELPFAPALPNGTAADAVRPLKLPI